MLNYKNSECGMQTQLFSNHFCIAHTCNKIAQRDHGIQRQVSVGTLIWMFGLFAWALISMRVKEKNAFQRRFQVVKHLLDSRMAQIDTELLCTIVLERMHFKVP